MKKPPEKKHIGFSIAALLFLFNSVAVAEVVVVVSAQNPVTSLSRNQIVNIFLGKTNRFPDGSLAVPVDQLEGSADRNEFYNRYANQSPAQIKAHWSKIIFTGRGQPPRQVANGAEVIKAIAGNPNAIGYVPQSMVNDSVRAFPLLP